MISFEKMSKRVFIHVSLSVVAMAMVLFIVLTLSLSKACSAFLVICLAFFPYTSWCIKICRENIFFRLEEAHSSEQKLVSFPKIDNPVIEKLLDTLKQTG